MNERELAEGIEEFFNEEDRSVGLYSVGWIDKNVVAAFKEAFEGVEIEYYYPDRMEFRLDDTLYKVAIYMDGWKLYRVIDLVRGK